jgi:hypothetical protein
VTLATLAKMKLWTSHSGPNSNRSAIKRADLKRTSFELLMNFF